MNTNFLSKLFATVIIILSSIMIFPQDSSAGVNPDGSFSYSVPIKVPEGTNGMQPNLSLAYNSNNKNGIVGYGWQLQGLPSIIRDFGFPEENEIINFSTIIESKSLDRFVGPNGRLVQIDKDVYHYTNENFSRFLRETIDISFTFGSSYPWEKYITEKWVETKPNGLKYYYGYTDDSRLEANSRPDDKYRKWALSKIEDIYGNSIEIVYYTDSDFETFGALYPKRIIYTKNDGLSKFKAIEFEYEDRKDYCSNYRQGSKVEIKKRLKRIIIKTDISSILGLELFGQTVRKYELEYGSDQLTSKLQSISEVNSLGESKKTNFAWNDNTKEISINEEIDYASYLDNQSGKIYMGDWNGDGITDFLLYDNATGNNTWHDYPGGTRHNGPTANPIPPEWLMPTQSNHHGDIVTGDFNGDGFMDIYWYNKITRTGRCFINKTPRGAIDPVFILNENLTHEGGSSDSSVVVFANDINKDGLTDLIQWDPGTGHIYTRIITKKNGKFVYANLDQKYGTIPSEAIKTNTVHEIFAKHIFWSFGDWNGDGITDICIYNQKKKTRYFFKTILEWIQREDSNAKALFQVKLLDEPPSPDRWNYMFFGDFNGDGITDIAEIREKVIILGGSFESVYDIVRIGINNGNLEIKEWIYLPISSSILNQTGQIYPYDINQDGKSDIVCLNKSTGDNWIFLNRNASFHPTNWENTIWDFNPNNAFSLAFTSQSKDPEMYFGGYNNTGSSSSYLFLHNKQGMHSFHKISHGKDMTITNIVTPLGKTISIEYERVLNQDREVTEDDEYPIRKDSINRKVVKKLEIRGNNSFKHSYSFDYSGGAVFMGQIYESKNLGFECVVKKDLNTGLTINAFYDQKNYTLGAKPKKIEYIQNYQLVQKHDYIYEEFETQFKYKDYPEIPDASKKSTKYSRLKNISTTTYDNSVQIFNSTKIYTYNEFGAVTSIIDQSSGTDTIESTTDYFPSDLDNWILNLPELYKIKSNGITLKQKRFSYTGRKLDYSEIHDDEKAKWLKTSFTYDSFGNIETQTDALLNTTTYIYDDDYHAYPKEIIDPQGHKVSIAATEQYDSDDFSTIISVTGPNLEVTKYKYDHFERLKEVVKPGDDWSVRVDYNDALSGNTTQQYTTIKTKDTSELGYHYKNSFYDGFGNIYKTESKTDNNQVLVKEIFFDEKGRIKTKSNSFLKDCDSPNYTTYEYDSLSRISKVIAPYGSDLVYETYSYGNTGNRLKVTRTNANGNQFISEIDSRGKLRKKLEPHSADIEYFYTPLGQIEKIIQEGSITTSIEYNSLGQRKSITDPNTGTWSYTYDDIGRLKTEKDARNYIINYDYEGVLLKRKYTADGEIDINYFYNQAEFSNGIGRLTSVSKKDGSGFITYKYGYDNKGNISSVITNIDNMAFSMAYDYDNANRLKTVTYPDNSSYSYNYSDTGILKSVKQGEGHLVQYGRVRGDESSGDCSTLVMKRVTGNGYQTDFEYNSASLMLKSLKTKKMMTGDASIDIDVHQYQPNSRNANSEILIQNVSYQHDNIGNITNINNLLEPAKSQEFHYDQLNRLSYAKGIYGEGYFQYDAMGNLRNKGLDSSSVGSVDVNVDIITYQPHRSIGSKSVSLYYEDSQHPYAVTRSSNGSTYSYDANGNMTSRKGVTFTFNKLNKLTATSNGEKYTYDHSGHRIRHITADGKTVYNIGGLFEIIKNPGNEDINTKLIIGINGELVAKTPALEGNYNAQSLIVGRHLYNLKSIGGLRGYMHGLAYLFVYDIKYLRQIISIILVLSALLLLFLWIKNVVIIYNSEIQFNKWAAHLSPLILFIFLSTFGVTGCFTDTAMYFPKDLDPLRTYYFHPDHNGSISLITNGNGDVVARYEYTPYGNILSDHSTGIEISDEKYTGQKYDSGTGLHYYNARYYDSEIGRFISPDAIIDGSSTTQGWNRYMYVHGNPVMNNDPSGHQVYKDEDGHIWFDALVIPVGPGSGYSPDSDNGTGSGIGNDIGGGTGGGTGGGLGGGTAGGNNPGGDGVYTEEDAYGYEAGFPPPEDDSSTEEKKPRAYIAYRNAPKDAAAGNNAASGDFMGLSTSALQSINYSSSYNGDLGKDYYRAAGEAWNIGDHSLAVQLAAVGVMEGLYSYGAIFMGAYGAISLVEYAILAPMAVHLLREFPTKVWNNGAVYKLVSPNKLVVFERHLIDIKNIFNIYKGRMNLFRPEYWKHVLPHRHIYRLQNAPDILKNNWRKTFQKNGAIKDTIWFWEKIK